MRTPFLTASILLASVLSCSKGGTDPVEEKPVPPAPVVEPEEPSLPVLCVDQPIVLSFESAPVLGTSGLVQVFKADGTLVDKINLADIASVNLQDNGIMLPKAAITADTPMNTFMDAVKGTSGRFRVVHYTPLRVKGKTLEIKLHGSSLVFGGSYYLTMDESVCGTAVAKFEFKVKAVPSGNTLKVNPDGSADFCTIQGAITHAATLGKDTAVTIEISAGEYQELLYARDKNKLTLKGASSGSTVIRYVNSEKWCTSTGGNVSSVPADGKAVGKSGGRSIFLVESCDDLTLENLAIENLVSSTDGQAECLYFNADGKKLTIEGCKLISWQDTFLCKGEVYVYGSLIAGHCDYIWGYPQACLFEDCEIRSRAAGYIVQARCPSGSKGFVFLNCKLTGESGVKDGSMYLARSGGSADYFDNVTYVNCTMSQVIAPAGWHTGKAPNPSKPTATQGWKEYGTKGVSTSSRNSYGRILTVAEAEAYSSKSAVLGW